MSNSRQGGGYIRTITVGRRKCGSNSTGWMRKYILKVVIV